MLHFEFEKLPKVKQFKILNKVKLNFNKQMNYTITNHDLMIEKDKFKIIWEKRQQPKAREFLKKYTIKNIRYIKNQLKGV